MIKRSVYKDLKPGSLLVREHCTRSIYY